MKNLQDLFDIYLHTEPSAEKIKSATSMLIHVGKALNVSTQEEITSDYYGQIVPCLDDFFYKSPNKARLDKAILAEMIGRAGPKKNLKKILEQLLNDKDAEIRQFALQSLEFYGCKKPLDILPYIERYRKSPDKNMLTSAAHLSAKVLCSINYEIILNRMSKWCKGDGISFVMEILERLVYIYKQGSCENSDLNIKKVLEWSKTYCGNKVKVRLEAQLI